MISKLEVKNFTVLNKDLLTLFKHYCNEDNNLKAMKNITGTKLRREIIAKYPYVKETKNIYNPETKKSTGRGLKGLKINDDILAEYQNNPTI